MNYYGTTIKLSRLFLFSVKLYYAYKLLHFFFPFSEDYFSIFLKKNHSPHTHPLTHTHIHTYTYTLSVYLSPTLSLRVGKTGLLGFFVSQVMAKTGARRGSERDR